MLRSNEIKAETAVKDTETMTDVTDIADRNSETALKNSEIAVKCTETSSECAVTSAESTGTSAKMTETAAENTEWTLGFQGAESRLWFAEQNGLKVVKKERFVKKYRNKDLDSRLTRERTRAEVKAIMKIKAKSPQLGESLPTLLFVNQNNIIMTRIEDSVNVCQYLTQISDEKHSNEELLETLGQTIADIHSCGVIHGDLTTSNFLIKDNNPKHLIPIDFGLSSFSTSTEDRAVDLYVLERAIISSHPNINFEAILQSYEKQMDGKGSEVLRRLDVVRQRGRKKLLIG